MVPQSDDNLWSDFPMPSSPPFFAQSKALAEGGLGDYDWGGFEAGLAGCDVDVWEDGTATEAGKGWENVFEGIGSDAVADAGNAAA